VTTLHPTKGTGAAAKPTAVTYVDPAHDATATPPVQAPDGLDPDELTDLLSAMLTHERCGAHLYRSVATRTTNEDLRTTYQEFGAQTERHVAILEELVTELGGNPQYVSASARLTERAAAGLLESTFMLDGSAGQPDRELAMLEAVTLAEAKDHANWDFLVASIANLPDTREARALRAATEQVEPEEEQHLSWCRDTRAQLLRARLFTDDAVVTAEEGVIDLTQLTKEELYSRAQDLNVHGRSDMTKDQLVKALEKH